MTEWPCRLIKGSGGFHIQLKSSVWTRPVSVVSGTGCSRNTALFHLTESVASLCALEDKYTSCFGVLCTVRTTLVAWIVIHTPQLSFNWKYSPHYQVLQSHESSTTASWPYGWQFSLHENMLKEPIPSTSCNKILILLNLKMIPEEVVNIKTQNQYCPSGICPSFPLPRPWPILPVNFPTTIQYLYTQSSLKDRHRYINFPSCLFVYKCLAWRKQNPILPKIHFWEQRSHQATAGEPQKMWQNQL